MREAVKRIVLLGAAFLMSFGIFAGCGSNYTYQEGDFRLTVTVDKTEVQVGGTITVTAKLENLSGEDLPIVFFDFHNPNNSKTEHILHAGLLAEGEDFAFSDAWFQPSKKTLKKNSSVTFTKSVTIEDANNRVARAVANFYVGKETNSKRFFTENTAVNIQSDKIKINII
jgi:hypothetical protein